jgi:hypothetical protein
VDAQQLYTHVKTINRIAAAHKDNKSLELITKLNTATRNASRPKGLAL